MTLGVIASWCLLEGIGEGLNVMKWLCCCWYGCDSDRILGRFCDEDLVNSELSFLKEGPESDCLSC